MEKELTNLDNLSNVNRRIVELVVSNPAISDSKIAAELGISRQAVNKRKNQPDVKEAIKDVQMTAIELFKEYQGEAVETLRQLMNSENEHTRLQAAKEFVKSLQIIKFEGELRTPDVKITFTNENNTPAEN